MKTPAHRRKKDVFRRQILAPRIAPPTPRCEECGKVAHPTQLEAISSNLHRQAQGAPPLRVYECPRGHGFHLTSMRKEA